MDNSQHTPVPGYALWKSTKRFLFSMPEVHPYQTLVSFVPPPLWILLSIMSVQLGAAIAVSLFQSLGVGGTVFLRNGFSALVFMLVWRPRLRGYSLKEYLLVILFGLSIAAMNTIIYLSIARIPMGIAVTLEFLGPLGVAIAGSRRWIDLVWTACAAVGVLLLAPLGNTTHLDLLGIGFALLAGVFWAGYILLSARVGRSFPGGDGLALGMSVAAIALLPLGITQSVPMIHDPHALLLGLGVALLSSVVPFSCELEALRRVPARTFGILMSLEPAVATLLGFLLLKQTIDLRGFIALALIVMASAGTSFFQR